MDKSLADQTKLTNAKIPVKFQYSLDILHWTPGIFFIRKIKVKKNTKLFI